MNSAFGCYKSTIRLRSGLYFDLRDPQPDQFTLADIAGALSKICRFGGQIDQFYSVAEHSFNCARQARYDGHGHQVEVAALMHDAAEAFCGDVVKPLKMMIPEYREIEKRIEAVIEAKFGIEKSASDIVKEIDMAMLIAERRALFSADNVEWTGENSVRRISFVPLLWNPTQAEQAFVNVANFLLERVK